MVAFTDVKNKHKYTEIENKFAKTLQCTYISINNMCYRKGEFIILSALYTEPSTPKKDLVKKPLNFKFIK